MDSIKDIFNLIRDLLVTFVLFFVWFFFCTLGVGFVGLIVFMFFEPNGGTVPNALTASFFLIGAILATILSIRSFRSKRNKRRIQQAIKMHAYNEKLRLASLEHQDRQSSSAESTRVKATASIDNSAYLTYGGVEAELLNVDLMEGHDFEYWCASLLRKIGFQKAEVTQASGDDGVDIIAEKDGIRYAIQCKRYNSDLGNKPIQEVHTGKAVYHCHVGAVMTNQRFTAGGKRAAEATGTLLWDRDWIRDKLSQVKPEAVVPLNRPTTATAIDDELYPAAVDAILSTGQASVSMVQRKLGCGYARAAQLVDTMEAQGIIGPFAGSKPRAILITKQQWDARTRR